MPAIELRRRPVERIWGRDALPPPFGTLGGRGEAIGEIWFEAPAREPELLVKYLFTSQPLSVQVHPDAAEARRRGLRSGKDEAWLILDAEPGAAIGLGLKEALPRDALRAAALSGEVERLLDWRPVAPGDIIYAPAGTIHAIGAGLSLIEIQQNCDVTYRLWDYGRNRELQVEDAVRAAHARPCRSHAAPGFVGEGREIAVEGEHLVVERWTGERTVGITAADGRSVFLVAATDSGHVDNRPLSAGTAWLVEGRCRIRLSGGAQLLVAYGGAEARPDLFAAA